MKKQIADIITKSTLWNLGVTGHQALSELVESLDAFFESKLPQDTQWCSEKTKDQKDFIYYSYYQGILSHGGKWQEIKHLCEPLGLTDTSFRDYPRLDDYLISYEYWEEKLIGKPIKPSQEKVLPVPKGAEMKKIEKAEKDLWKVNEIRPTCENEERN